MEAACWAAAMVCVAEAAACLAACFKDRIVRTRPRHSYTLSLAYPARAIPQGNISVPAHPSQFHSSHSTYTGLVPSLTSRRCTSFFLMAFCAAALVAMRRPSAASRSRCCCSSLSGWAAAP